MTLPFRSQLASPSAASLGTASRSNPNPNPNPNPNRQVPRADLLLGLVPLQAARARRALHPRPACGRRVGVLGTVARHDRAVQRARSLA